ncbi:hypothetical protein JCM10212_002707 [Sporobolomyces blumeae]
MALDLSDPSIQHAYSRFRSPTPSLNWIVLAYRASPTKLAVARTGSGGLDELLGSDSLDPNEVQHGLLRYEDRVVLWSLTPESLQGVKRAKALVHSRALSAHFKGAHIPFALTAASQLNASRLRDLLQLDVRSNPIAQHPSHADPALATTSTPRHLYSSNSNESPTSPSESVRTEMGQRSFVSGSTVRVHPPSTTLDSVEGYASPANGSSHEAQLASPRGTGGPGSPSRSGNGIGGGLARKVSAVWKGKGKATNQTTDEVDRLPSSPGAYTGGLDGRSGHGDARGFGLGERDRRDSDIPPALPEKNPGYSPQPPDVAPNHAAEPTSRGRRPPQLEMTATPSPRHSAGSSSTTSSSSAAFARRQHQGQETLSPFPPTHASSPAMSSSSFTTAAQHAGPSSFPSSPNLGPSPASTPQSPSFLASSPPAHDKPTRNDETADDTSHNAHAGLPPLAPVVAASPPPSADLHPSSSTAHRNTATRPVSESPAARMMLGGLSSGFDSSDDDDNDDNVAHRSRRVVPEAIEEAEEDKEEREEQMRERERDAGRTETQRAQGREEQRGRDRAREEASRTLEGKQTEEDGVDGLVESYGAPEDEVQTRKEDEVANAERAKDGDREREGRDEAEELRRREEEEAARLALEQDERERREVKRTEQERREAVERERVRLEREEEDRVRLAEERARAQEEAEAEAERERARQEEREREEAERVRLAQLAEAEERERTRKAHEEMRLMIERERAERALREEEEQRRREEARVRAKEERRKRWEGNRERDEVLLKGEISVQASGSMLWRRRYFELKGSSLTLAKSQAEIAKPLDVLSTASISSVHPDAEEALVPHSFKLVIGDSDDDWLFYADDEMAKEELVEALRVATAQRR